MPAGDSVFSAPLPGVTGCRPPRVASALVRPADPVPFVPGATSDWPLPVRGSSGIGRSDGAGLRAGGCVACGCIGCKAWAGA